MVRDNRHGSAYIFGVICPQLGIGAAMITQREHQNDEPAFGGDQQPAGEGRPGRTGLRWGRFPSKEQEITGVVQSRRAVKRFFAWMNHNR
jgi:hypothetical protein